VRWALLGIVLIASCRGPSAEPPSTFSFVDHVDRAEREFDETRFRSFRPDGLLSGQVTLGRETRRALMPPLPSRLTFEVEIPPEASLRFGIAVSALGAEVSPAHVEFRVRLDDGGGEPETVFEGIVRRREPNRFFDHEVDLSRWSGSHVRLTLDTSSPNPSDLPMVPYWAHPVVVGSEIAIRAPNVILISLDCVRADHLGAYGYERSTSPRLDELAREAVVFETATAVSSFTHPTHMTMLTGLPPSIHGVSRWRKPDSSVAYLPEILSRAGFRTNGIVSGPLLSQSFGFERGFDVYHAFHDETRAPELADAALEMLRRGRGQPQFLFLHFFDAHWPYWPGDELNTLFGPLSGDTSGLLHKVRNQIPPESDRDVQHMMDLYDAEIVYLDREVGRFFDELRKMGMYESSLILVTADHGEAFLEHGFWEHGQTLYQEMVHVPLLVKWPGEPAPQRVEGLVGQTDLFPTILEAAGIERAASAYAGVSLPRFNERRDSTGREVVLELTWDPLPERPARMLVAFRSERYKYIASFEAPTVDALYSAPVASEELYDLIGDPGETKNLAPGDESTLAVNRKKVLAYLGHARELRATRTGQEVEMDEELRKRLKILGYIER
jgi:arylsulfatase